MASIRDRVFSDAELRAQIDLARYRAEYARTRNKQDHYEAYETLATALTQALRERDEARALTLVEA